MGAKDGSFFWSIFYKSNSDSEAGLDLVAVVGLTIVRPRRHAGGWVGPRGAESRSAPVQPQCARHHPAPPGSRCSACVQAQYARRVQQSVQLRFSMVVLV